MGTCGEKKVWRHNPQRFIVFVYFFSIIAERGLILKRWLSLFNFYFILNSQ